MADPIEPIDKNLATGDTAQQNGPTSPVVDPDANKPPADDPELLAAAAAKELAEKNAKEAADAEAYDKLSDEDKVKADKAAKEADDKAEADAKLTPEELEAKEKADKEEADKKAADEANEDGDKELDTELWGDTSSETGNAVLQMLQNAGVTPDEAKAIMFDAVVEGDMSKLDKATLEEKLGKNQAFLAIQGIQTFITDRKATGAEAVKTVHEQAGGEENWVKVRDWANDTNNMPEAQLDEYAGMIDKGGAQAKFAISEMMAAYAGDTKNSDLAPALEEADTSATPAIEPIGKVDYADKYDAIYNDKSLSEQQRSRKLAALNTQRAAGRTQGM